MAATSSLPANIRPSPSFPLDFRDNEERHDHHQSHSRLESLQSILYPSRHMLATAWSHIQSIRRQDCNIDNRKLNSHVPRALRDGSRGLGRDSVSSVTPLRRDTRRASQSAMAQGINIPQRRRSRTMSTTVHTNGTLRSLTTAATTNSDARTLLSVEHRWSQRWRIGKASSFSILPLKKRKTRSKTVDSDCVKVEQTFTMTVSTASTQSVTDATLHGASYFLERDHLNNPDCCAATSSSQAYKVSPSTRSRSISGALQSTPMTTMVPPDVMPWRRRPSFLDSLPEHLSSTDLADTEAWHVGEFPRGCRPRPAFTRTSSSIDQLVRGETPPPTPFVVGGPYSPPSHFTPPTSVHLNAIDEGTYLAADGKRYPRVTVLFDNFEFLPSEARRVDVRTMDDDPILRSRSLSQARRCSSSRGGSVVGPTSGGPALATKTRDGDTAVVTLAESLAF